MATQEKKQVTRAKGLIVASTVPSRRRAGFIFGTTPAKLSSEQIEGMTDEQYDELLADPYMIVIDPASASGDAKKLQVENEARANPNAAPPVMLKTETITPAMEQALLRGDKDVPLHPASVGGGTQPITSISSADIRALNEQDTLRSMDKRAVDLRPKPEKAEPGAPPKAGKPASKRPPKAE